MTCPPWRHLTVACVAVDGRWRVKFESASPPYARMRQVLKVATAGVYGTTHSVTRYDRYDALVSTKAKRWDEGCRWLHHV